MMLDNPHHFQSFSSVRSHVSHHPTCKRETQILIRKRASGVVENLWVNLHFWLSSFGKTDVDACYPAMNSISNYTNLCTLSYSQGLPVSLALEQQDVHKAFREQLTRNREEGWNATGLPWNRHHPPLPANIEGSLCRLPFQVFKLRRMEKLWWLSEITHNQHKEGVVESATHREVGSKCFIELSSCHLHSLFRLDCSVREERWRLLPCAWACHLEKSEPRLDSR